MPQRVPPGGEKARMAPISVRDFPEYPQEDDEASTGVVLACISLRFAPSSMAVPLIVSKSPSSIRAATYAFEFLPSPLRDSTICATHRKGRQHHRRPIRLSQGWQDVVIEFWCSIAPGISIVDRCLEHNISMICQIWFMPRSQTL